MTDHLFKDMEEGLEMSLYFFFPADSDLRLQKRDNLIDINHKERKQ